MRIRAVLVAVASAGLLGALGCSSTSYGQRSASGPLLVDPSPVVFVRPVTASGASDRIAQLNREELTGLLVRSLKSEGIQAVTAATADSPVDYLLTCAASQVGSSARGFYPRRVSHAAALTCSISDPDTGGVHWQRELQRGNDLTKIINTMTKLPARDDVAVLHECVLPVWDGMAYGVRLFLERPAPLRQHARIADGDGASSQALVQGVERWTK